MYRWCRPAVVWARLLLQSMIIHQKRRHFLNFRTTLHLHQWHAVTSSSSPVFRWWLRGHCSSITPALRPSFARSFLFSFPSTLLFIVLHLFSACSPPSPVSPRHLLSLLKYSWRLDLRGSRRVALIYVRLASLLTRWLDVRYGIGGWTRPERSSEEAALGGPLRPDGGADRSSFPRADRSLSLLFCRFCSLRCLSCAFFSSSSFFFFFFHLLPEPEVVNANGARPRPWSPGLTDLLHSWFNQMTLGMYLDVTFSFPFER